jgi:hypothetical protein
MFKYIVDFIETNKHEEVLKKKNKVSLSFFFIITLQPVKFMYLLLFFKFLINIFIEKNKIFTGK